MHSLEIRKIILMLVTILASQATLKNVHTFMQDANNNNSADQPTPPSVKMLEKEVKQLQTERDWYKAEYQKLVKMFVAQNKRSERHISSSNTPWLPFENQQELEEARKEAEAEAQAIIDANNENKENNENETKPGRRKSKSRPLPANLPEVKKLCDVPEQDRVCPEHGPMNQIGTDSTQTLVYVPPQLYRLVTEYPKYACTCCTEHGVKTAERPTGLVEGNKYDTSVAATIVVHKYDQHLPLYRQTDIFAGSGWSPSRSTLQNILQQVDFAMLGLFSFMAKAVQGDGVVGIDESSCRMLMPDEVPQAKPGDLKTQRLIEKMQEAKNKGESSLMGKMWAYRGLDKAPYNIFDFRISRHRDGPDEFFRNSQCIVQGDCFSGNTSVVVHSDDRLRFAACWAHARRKVYEVNKENPRRNELLNMIHGLYDINAREQGMNATARTEHRQKHAVPTLLAIKKYIDTLDDQVVLPKSDLGEALGYLRNHWEALCVYASDGRVPIDNNRVEQLMREVALGRKNWLFVGNVPAGERSARLMTIVSSAKRHHLDVWQYLKDVLDRLLAGETDYAKLTPDAWKLDHPEAVRTYREEESRYKSDRKQLDRARRVITAKLKRQAN